MPQKKTIGLAAAAVTLGAASILGLSTVSAATSSNNGEGSLVDKIASTFNLDKDKVQEVFDADRAEHDAEHEAKLEERLAQAVKDGKITEDQKAKIIAKTKELKTEMENSRDEFKNMTEDERHAHMEQQRKDLEQWAKDNDIPDEFLMFRFGGGPGRGEHVMRLRTQDHGGSKTDIITD